MALYKWVRDEIEKLSYVERIEFKNTRLKIFYIKNNIEVFKTIPYRADKYKLLEILKNIREELGINQIKKEEFKKHLRPMIVHASWLKNNGETDGKRNENSTSQDN